MKRVIGLIFAFAFLILSDGGLQAQPRGPRRGEAQSAGRGWLSSLQAGKAEAAKSGKPLMVVIRCVP